MSWDNFAVNEELPQCNVCGGYDSRVMNWFGPDRPVCMACCGAIARALKPDWQFSPALLYEPEDFDARICEVCAGSGSSNILGGGGPHFPEYLIPCLPCEGNGRMIELKPAIVRLAEQAE